MLTVILLPACRGSSSSPELPELTETFSKKDKNPFGAYIAYKAVQALYANNTVRDKKQDFIKTWKAMSDTAALYICIAPVLFVNEEEVEAMLQYVNMGNDLFISASVIDQNLLKKINCNQKFTYSRGANWFESLTQATTRSLIDPGAPYSYYYLPFDNYFSERDSSRTRVVGMNQHSLPNSIVYFYGRGKLFLHCDPRAFSNYFLLKDSNYKYLQQSLAFTGSFPQHVYWDDHYARLRSRKKGANDDNGFSAFSEIMKFPPLVYAFWGSLLLLLLYILFNGKRVQRIIDLRKPNENTTVTFTETIGRLYLQKKDNKNISDKMITYFNEYIRNKYFLNTNLINEDFIIALSRKSGVQREKVASLYQAITDAQASKTMDDYQLLSLNEQIQNFHKIKN